MSILTLPAPARNVNPAASADPRDSWPDWTDSDRWELGPESDDFAPTPEDEAEAAELLNGDGEPSDADWDCLAEDALHLEMVCSGLLPF